MPSPYILTIFASIVVFSTACTNDRKHSGSSTQYSSIQPKARPFPEVQDVNGTEGTSVQADQLSDLFPEGTEISFTPDQVKSGDPKYSAFRQRLASFENRHPINEGLDADQLLGLVNNEVFSNSETFVHSDWLKYFLERYKISIIDLEPVVELAIKHEDLDAIKNMLNYGYVVDARQLELAKDVKNAADRSMKFNRDNKGLDEAGDPTFYETKYSKIDQIQRLLMRSFSANVIKDSDGFTNLRQEKGSGSTIVEKIASGSHIKVLDNTDEWFEVETAAGNKGYIYYSEISAK